jgi:hypothetical protein
VFPGNGGHKNRDFSVFSILMFQFKNLLPIEAAFCGSGGNTNCLFVDGRRSETKPKAALVSRAQRLRRAQNLVESIQVTVPKRGIAPAVRGHCPCSVPNRRVDGVFAHATHLFRARLQRETSVIGGSCGYMDEALAVVGSMPWEVAGWTLLNNRCPE